MSLTARLVLPLFAVSLALSGCGSGQDGLFETPQSEPVVPSSGTTTTLMAPDQHPPFRELASQGGQVVRSMELWTVVWRGDEALGAQVNAFNSWMLGSGYWAGALGQYGIGAGTAKGVLVIPTNPPASLDDSGVTPLLQKVLQQWNIQPNANTTFAFIIPRGTQVTSSVNGVGCKDFLGYHYETTDDPSVPYTINMQCPRNDGSYTIDDLTVKVSHEAAEAAANPHPSSAPGWVAAPTWFEVADMCNDVSAVINGHTVSRLYSNAAAAAGNLDPCVPAPAGPFFNAVIDPGDLLMHTDASGHGSATAILRPFSFGNTPEVSWMVDVMGAGITVSPAEGTSRPGQGVPITVNVTSGPQPHALLIRVLVSNPQGNGQWANESLASLTVR